MADFLFHKVSEKEKEDINREAKQIMDSFSRRLGRIDSKKLREKVIERDECERKEGDGSCSEINREIMFENASDKNSDFIIAERKKW